MATPNTCFNLRYLGHSVVSKFIPGLGILQKPLHDIYVNYLTPKGPAVPTICRLALTDRGILLTANGRDSFYSMRDVLLWEPVQWVYVQTQDRKIMSAFEPLNPDHHLSQEGLFSKLDGQYRYLAQLKHEPILSMALKKSSDSKQIEVHAFVCVSDDQAFEVSKALWRAEQVFLEQEAKGIGCANCSPAQQPAIQGQEAPRSVRSPAGGGQLQVSTDHSSFKGRKQSLRQGRGRKVDGEITLEELIRLADQATEPDGGGGGGWGSVAQEPPPPFMMGESWEAKERHKGVQRSRTFNEGQAANSEHWMGGGGGGGVSDSQPQQAPCYENLVPLQENVPKNSTPPTKGLLQQQQQQPEAPGVHQRHLAVAPVDSPQVNQRQKNPAPPASLRAVIADSKLSAANGKRPSVLPGTEFSNAVNHIAVEPQHNPVDDDDDDDDGPLPQHGQSKPVALVQPRKVPRYKVLPDAAPESAAFLRKVGGQKEDDHHRHHSGSAAKEQYLQAGLGGGGGGASGRSSYTRSMHEIDSSAGPKSVTPQPRRRTKDLLDAAADPATPKQLTGSDLNLSAAAAARRKSSVVPDPVKKLSAPEQRTSPSSSLAAAAAGAGHRSGGGERRKQEDTEGLESMNSDFDRNMMKTMLTHGTNFESALGYFP